MPQGSPQINYDNATKSMGTSENHWVAWSIILRFELGGHTDLIGENGFAKGTHSKTLPVPHGV